LPTSDARSAEIVINPRPEKNQMPNLGNNSLTLF
jgi:hypothetical protein